MNTDDRPRSSGDPRESLSPRLRQMREGIVSTVAATRLGQRRPSRRLLAGAISAFALAGALTGGLTAAAAVSSSSSNSVRDLLATTGKYDLTSGSHGRLVGTPSFETASGTTEIRLGIPPEGADTVEIVFQCLDPGTFTQRFNDVDVMPDPTCRKSTTMIPSTTTPSATSFRLTTRGTQTYTVSSSGSARYAVWVSWAKFPAVASASAQQEEEVSDGKVTREEYLAAFGRLEGCMAQAGHPFGLIPTNETNFQYSLTDASVAVFDTQCYPREFEQVDGLWQTEHPQ